jgi:hypothetical protein
MTKPFWQREAVAEEGGAAGAAAPRHGGAEEEEEGGGGSAQAPPGEGQQICMTTFFTYTKQRLSRAL